MRFCCLGSGSRGNGFVAEHGETTLLIDCGFSFTSLCRRLARHSLEISHINAVLVGHEHGDHANIGALEKLRAAGGVDFYMSAGTAQKINFSGAHKIKSGVPFAVGGMQISPVTVPHNACEPVQFVIDDGARRLGIFTDLGHITKAVLDASGGLGAVVVECNYDASMLAANGNYPAHIKERIAGKYGHLENGAAANFIAAIQSPRLAHIVAAHLSAENNNETLVLKALAAAGGGRKITIAGQENGMEWSSIS